MSTTPDWSAAKNGLPGDLAATNHAAQIDQNLGTHNFSAVYAGTRVLSPSGGTRLLDFTPGNSLDISQPFALSGTTIGRVVLSIKTFRAGADVRVTLCPDNGSGSPDTSAPIASTVVPAPWLTSLGAANGLENATTPLQLAQSNTLYCKGSITTSNWTGPAGDSSGVAGNASFVTDGNFMTFLGGFTTVPVGLVATAEYQGGTVVGLPMFQPSLPQATYYGGAATTSNAVVYAGGFTTVPVANVWTASWDVNTGTIGAWSAQQALPLPLWGPGVASYGDVVYLVGGTHDGIAATSDVGYAVVSDGQITSWADGPGLPTALLSPMLAAVNGWLVCAGGSLSLTTTPVTSVYIARINDDGSLGDWNAGPVLPVAISAYAPGWDIAATDNEIVLLGGFTSSSTTTTAIQILSITADSIAADWRRSDWNPSNVQAVGAFNVGAGDWTLVNPVTDASIYRTSTLTPSPTISVPLHATGLTNGATYHVVMQQHQTRSASDFVASQILDNALPSPLLQSARNSGGPWTAVFSPWAMPMEVYAADTQGLLPLHTWEDQQSTGSPASSNGASRMTTMVYDSGDRLTGYLEATTFLPGALNANPTFTTGTSPWTPVNCTLTQSSVETHGGFPFSGLLTPTGGFSTAYVESEQVPVGTSNAVLDGVRWFTTNGWFYSPSGYAGFSLSVNWYDSGGGYISTGSSIVALAAATWANIVNYFLAPDTAAYATIAPTESGTPTTGDVLYMSDVVLARSPETVPALSSAVAVGYDAVTGLPDSVSEI